MATKKRNTTKKAPSKRGRKPASKTTAKSKSKPKTTKTRARKKAEDAEMAVISTPLDRPEDSPERLYAKVKINAYQLIEWNFDQLEQRLAILALGPDDMHKYDIADFMYAMVGSMFEKDPGNNGLVHMHIVFEITGILVEKDQKTKLGTVSLGKKLKDFFGRK